MQKYRFIFNKRLKGIIYAFNLLDDYKYIYESSLANFFLFLNSKKYEKFKIYSVNCYSVNWM